MRAKVDLTGMAVQGVGSGVLGAILVTISLIMGKQQIIIPDSQTVIDSVLPYVIGIALLIVAAIMVSIWFASIFIEAWWEKRKESRRNKAANNA